MPWNVLIGPASPGAAPSLRRTRLIQTRRYCTGGGFARALDAATNGRAGIWAAALRLYTRFPLGIFVLPESVLGRSVHNEFLRNLVQGGPILLGAMVVVMLWLAVDVRPRGAFAFGPVMAIAWATAAMALDATYLGPFIGMGFYLIGWARGQADDTGPDGGA